MSREVVFVLLAVIASLIRYGGYFLSVYRKETRPHVFSWLNWGLVVAIGAYAQFELGGGLSAWGLVFVSTACFAFAVWALFVGEKHITRSDWITFCCALAVIGLWRLTENPSLAIMLVVAIDMLSYWPTIRKSWNDPWGEPPASYFWAGLRYFFLLFAVPQPTLSNMAYLFWLMSTDWAFAAYVLIRRQILGGPSSSSNLVS
jgi:hypothetical protein